MTVRLNKEERCLTALDKDALCVSLWFKKVAFGLWNEIRSKSPRPSRRPFVIIFFQFDNFSVGMHFLLSSCRLWCKPTAGPGLLLLRPLSGTTTPQKALQFPDGIREERWTANSKKVNQSNVKLGCKMGIMGYIPCSEDLGSNTGDCLLTAWPGQADYHLHYNQFP